MEDTIQEVCSSTNEILDAKLNEIYAVLEDIGNWNLRYKGPLVKGLSYEF